MLVWVVVCHLCPCFLWGPPLYLHKSSQLRFNEKCHDLIPNMVAKMLEVQYLLRMKYEHGPKVKLTQYYAHKHLTKGRSLDLLHVFHYKVYKHCDYMVEGVLLNSDVLNQS